MAVNSFPTLPEAEAALAEAARLNPGAWVQHSEYVARACGFIAARCPDIDPDIAYVCGLLHDIGRREGIISEKHLIAGYSYCLKRGWNKIGQICISHAFMIQDIGTSIGKWDVTENEYRFMEAFIKEAIYDEYDWLVQLCDSLALPSGFCLLEKRFVDVTRRYGVHAATLARWNRILEIKNYFELKTGCPSLYTLLPGVVENTFKG